MIDDAGATFLAHALQNHWLSTGDKPNDYRVGQALFNALPQWAGSYVAGKLFDPFYTLLFRWEAQDWIDNHLIFGNDGELVAVIDGDTVYERSTTP